MYVAGTQHYIVRRQCSWRGEVHEICDLRCNACFMTAIVNQGRIAASGSALVNQDAKLTCRWSWEVSCSGLSPPDAQGTSDGFFGGHRKPIHALPLRNGMVPPEMVTS